MAVPEQLPTTINKPAHEDRPPTPAPVSFVSRRREQQRLLLEALKEDIHRHLEGTDNPYGDSQYAVGRYMQADVWHLLQRLGNEYILDLVPGEERTKITHMVLEAPRSNDGSVPVVVGHVAMGKDKRQGVYAIDFRRMTNGE